MRLKSVPLSVPKILPHEFGADLARIWRLRDARSASRGWKERLWDPRGWKEHDGCHQRQMLRARVGGSRRIARGVCGFGRTCTMHVLDAYTINIISSRDLESLLENYWSCS